MEPDHTWPWKLSKFGDSVLRDCIRRLWKCYRSAPITGESNKTALCLYGVVPTCHLIPNKYHKKCAPMKSKMTYWRHEDGSLWHRVCLARPEVLHSPTQHLEWKQSNKWCTFNLPVNRWIARSGGFGLQCNIAILYICSITESEKSDEKTSSVEA